MRWNHKIVTLTVLLAIGITMVGCGASSSTAGSTAASTASTTSSEAQKTEVHPMQGVLLSDPLSDGTYHISFESDKYGSVNARIPSAMLLYTTMTGTQPQILKH